MPVYEQYFNKFVSFLNQYQEKLNEFELKKLLPSYFYQEEAIHPNYSVKIILSEINNFFIILSRMMKNLQEF